MPLENIIQVRVFRQSLIDTLIFYSLTTYIPISIEKTESRVFNSAFKLLKEQP